MNLELVKGYLENYLEDVIVPNINKEHKFGDSPITMELNALRVGSYQPPIFHVFIDVEPPETLKSALKKSEGDIADFLKIFSINNRVKVHWNKRPAF